jgi:hypothetical protein
MAGPNDKTTASSRGTGESQQGAGPGQQEGIAGMPMQLSLPDSIQVDPKRLLWYGGLVAVGALGVIEWPVVAAVGAGTYVAEHFAKDSERRTGSSPTPQ